jgi:hypothetical protein
MNLNNKYRPILLIASLLLASSSIAQVTIRSNANLRVKGQLTTNASIANSSTRTNLEEAEVTLLGSSQQVLTTQLLKVAELRIHGGGVKTFSGNWEVMRTLALLDGILKIGNGAKLLYSGTDNNEGNVSSYVDGFLYRNRGGRLHFPIGTGNVYAPAVIEDAPAGEFGIRTVAPGNTFSLPEGISANLEDRYWELSSAVASPVSLSLNDLGNFLSEGSPVVLESSTAGGTATSLSGSASTDYVTSIENVSQPILTIGKAAEFRLVIHDMITPFTLDDVNDNLFIENIEMTSINSVKLLDRWGLVVVEWKNYSNETDYDFSKLSPGNYVCIVEYVYPGESRTVTAKSIVTILKSN